MTNCTALTSAALQWKKGATLFIFFKVRFCHFWDIKGLLCHVDKCPPSLLLYHQQTGSLTAHSI